MDINLIDEEVLFGLLQDEAFYKTLNYVIMNAKFYIYQCKMNNNNVLSLYEFQTILKRRLAIEYNIYDKNDGAKDRFKYLIELYDNM